MHGINLTLIDVLEGDSFKAKSNMAAWSLTRSVKSATTRREKNAKRDNEKKEKVKVFNL